MTHALAIGVRRLRVRLFDPWHTSRTLFVLTWLYIAFTILPVLVAILFSFNNGRSIAVWQGFNLTRWYFSDPVYSMWHESSLHGALSQSLKLAALDTLVTTPLGLTLALGLARWKGKVSQATNYLMLFPLVMPELVMGVALFLLFHFMYTAIHPGTLAQLLGQVTFSIPYAVIVCRGRLLSIGREYEEAAADLGARPFDSLRLVLLPLMVPAILATMVIIFALSLDDFIVTQWLSCGVACDTVPIKIYSMTRQAPLPSLNAMASTMVYISLLSVLVAFGAYRFFTRHERQSKEDALNSPHLLDVPTNT